MICISGNMLCLLSLFNSISWKLKKINLSLLNCFAEFSTRCQPSWRTHETFESEAGALASVVVAELSKSFLTNQWPDPSPLKYALTYLEWVKDTSPHFNLTTASSGSLTDWSVHYIDLPGRANIFVHKMQRGWLSIDGRREDHETS